MFFSALEKCPGRAEMCAGFPFFVPSAPPCATSWTKEDLIIPPVPWAVRGNRPRYPRHLARSWFSLSGKQEFSRSHFF